jgi:hypothetical protein
VPLRSRLGPAWVRTERWDCTPMTRFPMSRCTQPVEQQPTKRIVLVGDSHLQQLAGALIPTARSHGWQLIAIVRGGLPVLHGVRGEPGRAGLPGLKQRRHRRDRRPAAGRGGHAGQPGSAARADRADPAGFVEQWRHLQTLGIPVLAVRDNPRFDSSMPDCVQNVSLGCGCPAGRALPGRPTVDADPGPAVQRGLPGHRRRGLHAGLLPAEIGNVLVYLDDNHLRASYSTSMPRCWGTPPSPRWEGPESGRWANGCISLDRWVTGPRSSG